MTSITSEALNYLVFRYLTESGFLHAAFVLGYEAGIHKSPVDSNLVPPTALIRFVQKGIQMLELEANLSSSETDTEDDFSFIQPMNLITKSVPELTKMIKEKHQQIPKNNTDKGFMTDHVECMRVNDTGKSVKDRDINKDKVKAREGREKRSRSEVSPSTRATILRGGNKKVEDGVFKVPASVNVSKVMKPVASQINGADVMIMDGHSSEVCAGAWSPSGLLFASGSGDSTARIWTIPDGFDKARFGPSNVVVLEHVKVRGSERNNDVTTLDWNGDGTLLATGSYDGHARLWSPDGELKSTLSKHKAAIVSLKWNKNGDYLLTGSLDKTAIVWDVKADKWKQQFQFHKDATLDVDWKNNTLFASCSADNMIHVCEIGVSQPIKTFTGHQDEVNCVKWDPTESLLASCSDDTTVKVWSINHDNVIQNFTGHCEAIYSVRWCPTAPGTSTLNCPMILASASFDSTVKLWDVEHGRLVSTLQGHSDQVYSIAFSPNGKYLASGSVDNSLLIWSVKDGRVVKTYSGGGRIFEVSWNNKGNKLAACFSNRRVCVFDFRM